jgi:hypothetical protein
MNQDKEKQARRIKASMELQQRVGTGEIEKKSVVAAQDVMDNTDVDFKEIAKPELDALQKAIDTAGKGITDDTLQSLKTPIMNLKANAAVFKYQMISELTGMVLILFETVDQPDKKIIKIADILHKTILLALAYGMSGDGGKNGAVLIKAFEQVCRKYKPKA